ncbi:MAG: hypothetical protein ACRC0X_02075 [Brevinema sp.]
MKDVLHNPHFVEARKSNKLIPKHFCELFGISPNNATRVKQDSKLSRDKKKIKVAETIDYFIANGLHRKIDWLSYRSLFTNKKSQNKSISPSKETSNKKNPDLFQKKSQAQNKSKPLEKINNNDKVTEVNRIINNSDIVSEYWRKSLDNILEFDQSNREFLKKLEEQTKDVLELELNPLNYKHAVEGFQKYHNILRDQGKYIDKEIMAFIVGSICEYMLQGCQTLILKNTNDESIAKDIEQQLLNMISSAQKDIQNTIRDIVYAITR